MSSSPKKKRHRAAKITRKQLQIQQVLERKQKRLQNLAHPQSTAAIGASHPSVGLVSPPPAVITQSTQHGNDERVTTLLDTLVAYEQSVGSVEVSLSTNAPSSSAASSVQNSSHQSSQPSAAKSNKRHEGLRRKNQQRSNVSSVSVDDNTVFSWICRDLLGPTTGNAASLIRLARDFFPATQHQRKA